MNNIHPNTHIHDLFYFFMLNILGNWFIKNCFLYILFDLYMLMYDYFYDDNILIF